MVYTNYENNISFESNPDLEASYTVQLQGIGFSAWLKNLQSFREADEEKKKMKKEGEMKKNAIKQKVEQKKTRFRNAFETKNESTGTK